MRFLLSLLFFFYLFSLIDAASPPSSVSLSNPSSTATTFQLYKYLISQYGKKVLSGQQEFMEAGRFDLPNINYVKSVSGLDVAVGGFDIMDYSPSRREKGANPNGFTESWINWARGNDGKKLGIVSICWHWNSPTDLKDESKWWTGFYTSDTNFNIASVLSAGPSNWKYQLLLRDIDAIAVELKKFRDQDIPILWRPLHEAYGKWFWWSSQGSSAFKQLWNLVYDRLTNYHQLNNLIWVYTGEARSSSEWTPDESKWDIYSLDLYLNPNGKTDETSWSSEWNAVVSKYNGKRLIALSETGSLPTPSRVRSSNTYWSWAMPWDGKFINTIDQNRIRSWMQDTSLVITRSNIDNWRNFIFVPPVFSIAVKDNSGRVFDISQEKNANGTPVIVWTNTGGWNQKFEWVSNGEQIRWVGTNKCLDVKDGTNTNGNIIFIWECSSNNANANQKFVKDGQLIRWKDTNKCLSVINGAVAIYDCNSSNGAQQFSFQ